MSKLSALDWIALILVIIGALNWGLVGLGYNLVEGLFGVGTLTTIIYILVGLSGIYTIFLATKLGRKGGAMAM